MAQRAESARFQLRGVEAVGAAIEAFEAGGLPVRLVIALEGWATPALTQLLERAESLAIPQRRASARELRRLSAEEEECEVLALVGDDPKIEYSEFFERPGVVWLLDGCDYPGNAGHVIRSAEVSGAAGVVVDARFDRSERRECLRFAMRADRFMPVFFTTSEAAIKAARASGRRIVAVEDVGDKAPWQVDLRGDLLLVVGGEVDGISAATLADVDEVIRVPMQGFIPSYNLQAAMAVVMGEWMRQRAGV